MPEFNAIALGGLDDNPPRAGAGREGQLDRSIQIESDAARGECDACFDPDLSAVLQGAQPPADAAEPEGSADVQDGFAQAVLQMLKMIRADAESVDELGSGIVGHKVRG